MSLRSDIETVARDFEEQARNCRQTYHNRNAPLRDPRSPGLRAPREPELLTRAEAYDKITARLRAVLPAEPAP